MTPDEQLPRVRILPAEGETRAVGLVLHGGRVSSTQPVRGRQLSVLRMIPFARALHASGAPRGLAVWRLLNRVRGWNGDRADAVVDARWALDEIRRRHGDVPVVIVGHSMGGRAAIRAADDRSVAAIVALAPWVPAGEPIEGLHGRHVAILHGLDDRWTDPAGSRELASQAAPIARSVRHLEIRQAGHFMLRRPALWHGLATYLALSGLVSGYPSDQSLQPVAPNPHPDGHPTGGLPLMI